MKLDRFNLKTTITAVLLGAAFGAPAAFAAPVGFDDLPLTVVLGNETVVSGGFAFQARDSAMAQSFGVQTVAGLTIDGSAPSSCDALACPSGNPTRYFAGVNDGSVTMTSALTPYFRLNALDFAFVSPLGGLANGIYGQLRLVGSLASGGTISTSMDFAGQDGFGNFMFAGWTLDPAFAGALLNELSFSACVFDAAGGCDNSLDFPAGNLAQFAIDNLDATGVLPEPAMPALLLLGAAGMGLSARRRRAK
ncbi:MAG: NF038120 family PEP-CTERM protein [Telluria sp.]